MSELVIGDVHATPDELDDVGRLLKLVENVSIDVKAERIIFLGDLHHTFAVTNVKVMGFYRDWFKQLNRTAPVYALVGNHDMPGTGAQYPNALLAYEDLITPIDQPFTYKKTLLLPYFADHARFFEAINKQFANHPDIKRIYCHQEFDGAQYDNGFFAPHGADPSKMPVWTISGHIHTPQTLGKVWYPGAPRWRTVSDANIERAIFLIDDDDTIREVDTGTVCKRIWHHRFIEGEREEVDFLPDAKDSYRFYIEGTPSFVAQMADKMRRFFPNPRISTVIKDKRIRVRESDGIDVAFKKYATNFKAKNATPPAVLMEKASLLLQRA
jgi:DNA repair exonuclease SbcCD nuclease subunit